MSGKAVRETLAALGVIASLVFVGWEIRQNTTAVVSATRQGLSDQLTGMNLTVMADEHMPGLIARVRDGALPADFTAEENQRIRLWYVVQVRLIDTAYQQVGLGVLSVQEYSSLPAAVWTFPYIHAAWPSLRVSFEPEFAEFFEGQFLR